MMVASSTQGMLFHCLFEHIDWDIVGSLYSCLITRHESSGNDSALLGVIGTHYRGLTNYNVRALSTDTTQSFNQFPTNIEIFFPNLLLIDFWSAGLTSLSADLFKPFPNLRVFSADLNRLVTLDGDLFKYTPNIQSISFRNNLIRNVGRGFLEGLSELKQVLFLNNPCIHFFAVSPEAIEYLKIELERACPPLVEVTTVPSLPSTLPPTTTDANECSIRCSINDEMDGLKIEVMDLKEKNVKLEERFIEQGEKMAELEMRLREISSNPCSSNL